MRGLAIVLLAAAVPATVVAGPLATACDGETCAVRLTAAEVLDRATRLVEQRRFVEAAPMIAALEHASGIGVERHFLAGYIAIETGQVDVAIHEFRAALAIDPRQTRVRLELARAMMMRGKDGTADYHFRLAQNDAGLPEEIVATIRASRGILRDRRPWRFSSEFGFAPDSNINNGSSAETVDVVLGAQTLPLTLDPNARAKSGVGQIASLSAGYRIGLGDRAALLVDGDTQAVNYKGAGNDDYTVQFAVGPELRTSDALSFSLQGTALQRWYGGSRAATQFGVRGAVQHGLDSATRIGLTLDARHTASGFSPDYSGWNLAAYATYERVVARSMIASASLFARSDRLVQAAYSSTEVGMALGLGGELAHGINAGVSATVSRAQFDAPLLALGSNPRGDWRLSGRVHAGVRSLRVLGFSPSVSYSYTHVASSLGLYDSVRSRFNMALARYF